MNQKLSDWASIAEIVGAIAIVISLVYVGIQVNDSTRAVMSASANDVAGLVQGWYLEVGSDPVASKVMADGMTDPESFSREDRLQFIFMMHSLFLSFQNGWYLASEGTLDLELRDTITNAILGVREQPGMNLYWAQRKALFKPDFQEYVDEIMITGVTNTDMEQLYTPLEVR